ncbi:MAG: nucleotidyltransferase domain-containing protein [Deltaproteobacteria bacterium]|nr:nucleotidyltransferase domain-containing protein [Deltaproteobacteria bacterium]
MTVTSVRPAVGASLERFRQGLAARFGPRLRDLRLFGSHARGEARPESDVDVLVLVDELTRAERREIIDLAADLDLEEFVGLAPLAMSTAHFQRLRALEAGLALDLEREGVPL